MSPVCVSAAVSLWLLIHHVVLSDHCEYDSSWRSHLISCFSAETCKEFYNASAGVWQRSRVTLTDSCSPAAAYFLFLLRLAPAADCTRPPSTTTRYELRSLCSALNKQRAGRVWEARAEPQKHTLRSWRCKCLVKTMSCIITCHCVIQEMW